MSVEARSVQTDETDDFDDFIGCGKRSMSSRTAGGVDCLYHIGVAAILEPVDHSGMGTDRSAALRGRRSGSHIESMR